MGQEHNPHPGVFCRPCGPEIPTQGPVTSNVMEAGEPCCSRPHQGSSSRDPTSDGGQGGARRVKENHADFKSRNPQCMTWNFPDGPVAKTLRSQSRGPGSIPVRELDPTFHNQDLDLVQPNK